MTTSSPQMLGRELAHIVGEAAVLPGDTARYLSDETETRGVRGHSEAVVLPGTAREVGEVVAWCYAHDVPIVPRGGGTGYAGGAVPLGGVVISLERLTKVRSFNPLLWRIEVEAGMRTAELRRVVRESGLFFPPDPGAAESSQLGGNVATNAGGPHAFKYGVTGAWVTGLEAVVAPGSLVRVGGPLRKDVAGYDLKSLLIGSEGTLGIITAVWLRLIPAPEAALPVVGFYPSVRSGCAAIENVLGSGIQPAALEYLDGETVHAAEATFPGDVPEGSELMVIADADGTLEQATLLQSEVAAALADDALAVDLPADPAALWRWREGVSHAVTARRGGKVSEDIVVPLDRLGEAIERTLAIGAAHGLPACSWGHAGDGNLHSTFLVASGDDEELERAERAAEELFALAFELGGSISGEHGIGLAKRGQLARQWAPAAVALHEAVKQAFDPKGLFNPGKKT